jgi:hypothetical protein
VTERKQWVIKGEHDQFWSGNGWVSDLQRAKRYPLWATADRIGRLRGVRIWVCKIVKTDDGTEWADNGYRCIKVGYEPIRPTDVPSFFPPPDLDGYDA